MDAEKERLKALSLVIYDALFSAQPEVDLEGESYRIRETRTGLRNVQYEGVLFIEQNPEKDSHHARMAQAGHQIMWVIKGRRYLARVIDGEYTFLR